MKNTCHIDQVKSPPVDRKYLFQQPYLNKCCGVIVNIILILDVWIVFRKKVEVYHGWNRIYRCWYCCCIVRCFERG